MLTYMGPGEPPLVPNFGFITAADDHRTVDKFFQDCNFVQGHEGNLDPVHGAFLHRVQRPDESDQQKEHFRRGGKPTIDVELTDFGARIYTVYPVDDERRYLRITNFVMPNLCAVPSRDGGGFLTNWHVPIDDEHHWKYMVFFTTDEPISASPYAPTSPGDVQPGFRLLRSKANRYLQDREEMAKSTFAGLGRVFVEQDTCVTEGVGPIQDRTDENLGSTDIGILTSRRVVLDAMDAVIEGHDPLLVVRDPTKNRFPQIFTRDEFIPASVDWRTYWKDSVGVAAERT
jgi:hypothetical protein